MREKGVSTLPIWLRCCKRRRDRRLWFREMLLGWLNRLWLLMNELTSIVSSAEVTTYTKPRLISPQTAAFVDKGILTFQTTWIGKTVQTRSVATAYAVGCEYVPTIVCSDTNMLGGKCYIYALWQASSESQTSHPSKP
jgi:hypothetical protein